jgi:hypothetical protein
MPEYPEVEGEQYVITRGKGSGLLPRAYGQLQVRFKSSLQLFF